MRPSFFHFQPKRYVRGFTLVEMIVGMVGLAIAMLLVTSILAPQAKRSVTPVLQMRAAELGSSLMQEILSKSFDENSDHNGGGQWRCGDSGQPSCTSESSYGSDSGESRTSYDDVDDYDTNGAFISITNAQGSSVNYTGFSYRVDVVSSDSSDSQLTGASSVKRIDLTVRTSSDRDFDFSVYRWNY